MLDERITITEGGRTRKITKREALIRSHLAKAIKGDPRALTALYALMRELDVHDAGNEIARAANDEELAILGRYIDREVQRRSAAGDPEDVDEVAELEDA